MKKTALHRWLAPERRMHHVALGLLLAMAALYWVAMTRAAGHAAWGYVAAFAEAAMVGAIADWFAVVALFRRPLGLPIPHTDIIASNKQRIGENLATFITTHFLSSEQLMLRLKDWDAAARASQWLSRPANARQVAARLAGLGHWAVGALHDATVRRFVSDLAHRGLAQIDITRLSGQVLEAMTHERRHQQLLDAALLQLGLLLDDQAVQDTIRENIAREVSVLKWFGLDQATARLGTQKLVAAVARTILDMAKAPRHPLRLRFDEVAHDFVQRLKTDPAMARRGERLKAELLTHPALGRYVNELWAELLAWLQGDLRREDSRIRQRIEQLTLTLGQRLAADEQIRRWIDDELRASVPALLARYRQDIHCHIVQRVAQWDARELTDVLERHIGRDLQFIRINGTVVGGLVGLALHALTHGWR